jgi:hypothetical protein
MVSAKNNKIYTQSKIKFPIGLLQLFLKFLSEAQQQTHVV